jgi:hypothetical protein
MDESTVYKKPEVYADDSCSDAVTSSDEIDVISDI